MAQAIVAALTLLLTAFITKPLWILYIYFFARPLVQVFANQQLTLFGLPITWPIGVAIVVVVFALAALKKSFVLNYGNLLSITLLTALSIVTWVISIDITTSIAQSLKYLNAVCIALLAVNAVRTKEQVLSVYNAIALSSIIPMALGYYQFITGTGHVVLQETTDRIVSVFGYANMYGIFLAIVLFCTLILLVEANTRPMKGRKFWVTIYFAILVSVIVSTLLAQNRGTWIALVASVGISAPFYLRHINFKWVILAGLVIAIGASGFVIKRFSQLDEDRSGANTFDARIEAWSAIASHLGDVPLLGYGSGTAPLVTQDYFNIDIGVPHNDYLRQFVELGFLGAFLYLLFLAKEGWHNINRFRRNRRAWHVNYFTLSLIIYWGIISMVQNVIHSPIVFPMFLVCCQMARRYAYLSRQ